MTTTTPSFGFGSTTSSNPAFGSTGTGFGTGGQQSFGFGGAQQSGFMGQQQQQTQQIPQAYGMGQPNAKALQLYSQLGKYPRTYETSSPAYKGEVTPEKLQQFKKMEKMQEAAKNGKDLNRSLEIVSQSPLLLGLKKKENIIVKEEKKVEVLSNISDSSSTSRTSFLGSSGDETYGERKKKKSILWLPKDILQPRKSEDASNLSTFTDSIDAKETKPVTPEHPKQMTSTPIRSVYPSLDSAFDPNLSAIAEHNPIDDIQPGTPTPTPRKSFENLPVPNIDYNDKSAVEMAARRQINCTNAGYSVSWDSLHVGADNGFIASNIKVTREGRGSILWPGLTRLDDLNIDRDVNINETISVYTGPDGSDASRLPQIGVGLNKYAIVTVIVAGGQTMDWSQQRKEKFLRNLEQYIDKSSGKLLDYDWSENEMKYSVSVGGVLRK